MKNIFKLLGFVVLATFVVGCPKTDDIEISQPIAYSVQKPVDDALITDFLATHYVDVSNDGKYTTTFGLVSDQPSKTPIKDRADILKSVIVNRNDLDYTIYYLKLNEGGGEKPIKVDSAFVSYKGVLLSDIETVFDAAPSPVWFRMEELITGWGEIIPKFGAATSSSVNSQGVVTYNDFGVGVMFLPSAFGYYNSSVGNIPAYANLIFNFKLYGQQHRDHDYDRVLTINEYYTVDADGNVVILNTDGDDIPDYLDLDDDNDGVLTKQEVKSSASGVLPNTYYSFNNIPSCSGDVTSPTRIRRHLVKCN